jgi:ABC-type multidrug transport system fused ATPase/permease subunit
MDMVETLAKTKTVILITHRLADARRAGRIAVLDHGRLAGLGSHGDLMREKGLYERMYREQRELEIFAAGRSLPQGAAAW